MENFSPIAQFLIALSKEASVIMLRYYSPLGVMSEAKSDMSPVTKADIEINEMVIREVKEKYPDYEVLGEEISTDITKSNKLFVVDPIDGTLMFAIGSPNFAFSAAVVVDGEPIAGVISNPLARRTLIAEKGKGTYLVETNSKVHVSNKDTLKKALIKGDGWSDIRAIRLLHKEGASTPEIYATCESGSLIAVGGFEGDIYTSIHPHDIAAQKIIVEEAGGKVTDIDGNEQRYDGKLNGAVISNGKLHDKLLEIVEKSGIKDRLEKRKTR